jgi:hypothetical protein
MNNQLNSNVRTFNIPNARIHPGYWVISIIFIIGSFRIASNYGLASGVVPFIFALALPFASYMARSRYPFSVEVNIENKTITQIYWQLGREKRVTIDARQFNDSYIQVKNSRFPTAHLVLRKCAPMSIEVELARSDANLSRDNDDASIKDIAPQQLKDIAIFLKEYFNITNIIHKQN